MERWKKWSQLITPHVLSVWMENSLKISCISGQAHSFRRFSQLKPWPLSS